MDTSYTYTVTANADIKVKFQSLFVEGGASLILSPDRLDIKVEVTTADNSSVRIEGCTETELTSGTETVLHATGTVVILKGKIIELSCRYNQLTALNVQGLTALQVLSCYLNRLTALNVQGLTALQGLDCGSNLLTALNVQGLTALQVLSCGGNRLTALNIQGLTALKELGCGVNQLNADAFKKLFDDLPQRADSDDANCILYTEQTGVTEGNHTDFTAPQDLKDAFNNAKNNKKWKMYKRNGSWPEVEI
ncbi:leucine-rich repeat domain-containing protein [Treponema socranskii]